MDSCFLFSSLCYHEHSRVKLLHGHLFIFWGIYLRMEWLDNVTALCSILQKVPGCFPKCSPHCIFHTAGYDNSTSLYPGQRLLYNFLNSVYTDVYELIVHCDLGLHFFLSFYASCLYYILSTVFPGWISLVSLMMTLLGSGPRVLISDN